MAENNFKVFDEDNANVMDDVAYADHVQRKGGVQSGVAISQLHNKLYRQTSIMTKAIADFIALQAYDATDADPVILATNLRNALNKAFSRPLTAHKTLTTLDHPAKSVTEPKLADGAVSTRTIVAKSVTEPKLADSGVTAGTYTKVTVDRTGRVTTAQNPTTLAGYGITDAYKKVEADSKFVAKNGDTITGPIEISANTFLPLAFSGRFSNLNHNPESEELQDFLNVKDAAQRRMFFVRCTNKTSGVYTIEFLTANRANLPIPFLSLNFTKSTNAWILELPQTLDANLGNRSIVNAGWVKTAISQLVTNLSIADREITYTKEDGSQGTITIPNMHDIVEQALDQSGYVQFRSGFIVQWGWIGITNYFGRFTYPKAMTSAYAISIARTADSTGEFASKKTTTSTYCDIVTSSSGITSWSIIVVGKI